MITAIIGWMLIISAMMILIMSYNNKKLWLSSMRNLLIAMFIIFLVTGLVLVFNPELVGLTR